MKSHYYINGKKTCCDPDGLYNLSRLILERIKPYKPDAIGGPTLGADPIVGAVTALSHIIGPTTPWFIVRKEPKGHGTQSQIEGADIAGKRVVIVEDVITTGGSVLKAIEVVQSLGCEVLDVIAIVDREQGGVEAFEKANISYSPIFTISELLPAEVLQRPTT
jgi:orotate phosphoribosyltransferase